MLGDVGAGYPPSLYPNLTYIVTDEVDPTDNSTNLTKVYAFPDFPLNSSSLLLLGPLQINDTYSMVSLTLPIINNTSNVDILGFMTVVADSSSLYSVLISREGLDSTGIVLLVGPANMENLFPYDEEPTSPTHTSVNYMALSSAAVSFVFRPTAIPGQDDRHSIYDGKSNATFTAGSYPAIFTAFSTVNSAINNASSDLTTTNEQGASVAVGWARPQSNLVNWVLLVEQTHDEAWAPVIQLRNILLACVFGTAGGIALLVIPMAHYSVLPIRRLKDATEKSVQPPGYTPEGSIRSEGLGEASGDEENPRSSSQQSKRGNGVLMRLRRLRRVRSKSAAERTEDARRRVFKIPGKVQDRKHFVKDELTELTTTFNEMSDELMMQYARLEERVAERTQELEISKKAAEAANESKTLFIANISHELKTPLNGILGMCAVCMGEDDVDRIKKSLQVVYKSGDLLLHLLNDLLTFSKNQIGQSLSLEEKEFSLSDVRSQIKTIFEKQVREGHINFGVIFISTDIPELSPDGNPERSPEMTLPAIGPKGTGRLKDMRLWGDQHRILQVMINLVSNSLKFTPEGGKVEVRIKCIGEAEKSSEGSRQESIGSRQGSQRMSRNRHRVGSVSNTSSSSKAVPGSAGGSKPVGTALLINPMALKTAQAHLHVRERSPTPPPANATTLLFEFEVEDTGPGISPALQQRVFEPFVQGDLGLSKKHGGTGLGLSICSQLATLMGGTITLESKVGVGSTFTMRIPLKFVRARAPSTASSDVALSHTPSLLSGDDRAIKKVSSDASLTGAAVNTTKAIGFEKDPQLRLVGLSQPFFAAGPATTTDLSSQNQLEILDCVAAGKSSTDKIRVLVAEDNLVNQEVVLRYVDSYIVIEIADSAKYVEA
jgi:osomolarity two-component system, sensor histidine kinase SLN1